MLYIGIDMIVNQPANIYIARKEDKAGLDSINQLQLIK